MKIKNYSLNKELAELIGAFIGDGFIASYNGSYHVEFTGHPYHDKEYFNYLAKIATKYSTFFLEEKLGLSLI